MSFRTRKILQMTTKHPLFDIPKYESTKGTTREDQVIALNLMKEHFFFKSSDKQPEVIISEEKLKHVEIRNNKEETNRKNCEFDYEIDTPCESGSSESEYIPDTSPSITEDEYESCFQQASLSVETQQKSISSNSYVTDMPSTSGVSTHFDEDNTYDKVDDLIVNFGSFVNEPPDKIEEFGNVRPWTKQNACPYCYKDVTHFPRHLIRNHKDKGAVKELMSLPIRSPKRKQLINIIRRQGNFVARSHTNTIRPIRRPRQNQNNEPENEFNPVDKYVACPDCLGYFKRKFLRRHRKNCLSKPKNALQNREKHLSLSQLFSVCVGSHGEFCSTLRLKSEVFPIMRNDSISKLAMKDPLICLYGESLLRKHKRSQIKNVISNKIRELGRLMFTLKHITGIQRLFDALKPRFFDCFVSATKTISGYSEETRNFNAPSLALHMGTTLKQVCNTAIKMILKQSPLFPCENPDEILKGIVQLSKLVKNHWNSEMSSLALKDLNEKQYEKPKLLPLTEDVIKFQNFLTIEAKAACNALTQNREIKKNFRRLSECILATTILLNRKRIGEIQYLTLKVYSQTCSENQQEEFLKSLSEAEKSLCKKFKRVITQGKGSKPVAILFSKDIQECIEVLLSIRTLCVPESNQYLFANPNTSNGCIHGYHSLKKLAEEAGVVNKNLFTSTRLRKHIATILQVVNITESEMEQFATFMGHTKKTHESYYRLPQDVFQTAKVSKLLLAINKGNVEKYKGKTLDEIDIETDLDEWDSEDESVDKKKKYVKKKAQENIQNEESVQERDNRKKCGMKKVQESIYNDSIEERDIDKKSVEERDKSCDGEKAVDIRKKKVIRNRWPAEDKILIKEYFKEHIKKKRAPRKFEVEIFLSKHEKIREHTNWVQLKAFVYNCYK